MPATITRMTVAPTFSVTNVSYMKNIMTSLGIPTGSIVYETTTEAIYKITNGTGTFADTYIRFFVVSNIGMWASTGNAWGMQIGTGFASNAITGAGPVTGYPLLINASVNNNTKATYFTTIVSSDGTYRQLMHFDTASVYSGGFAIIQPTNTSLNASACPLTYVASAATGHVSMSNPVQLTYVRSVATAQYGPITATGYAVPSVATFSATLSSGYGLTTAKAGSYGVQPFMPVQSGGWNIGYNSNLALTGSNLLPMDRILVTPGVEEYVVCDTASGLAVREV